jgi:sulfur carrier protein
MSAAGHDSASRIEVIANGQTFAVPSGASLGDFLASRGLDPRLVVVEHNGAALTPSQVPARPLAHGDRLEIVRIVAGG